MHSGLFSFGIFSLYHNVLGLKITSRKILNIFTSITDSVFEQDLQKSHFTIHRQQSACFDRVQLRITIVPNRAAFKRPNHPIFAKFAAFKVNQEVEVTMTACCKVTALLVLLSFGLRQSKLEADAVTKLGCYFGSKI